MRAYPEEENENDGRFFLDGQIPVRSLRQRMDALDRANAVRTYRKELKRDIKTGQVNIHDVLSNPPEEIETMKIFDLLLSVPKVGRVKVNKILVTCRVSPSKTIGGMSERQLNEVLSFLRRR
jgi:hypothetical protein